jgi:hypothetical protein
MFKKLLVCFNELSFAAAASGRAVKRSAIDNFRFISPQENV